MDPTALSDDFSRDASKQTQWRGFLQRTQPLHRPELDEVIARLAVFLGQLSGDTELRAPIEWKPEAGTWAVP